MPGHAIMRFGALLAAFMLLGGIGYRAGEEGFPALSIRMEKGQASQHIAASMAPSAWLVYGEPYADRDEYLKDFAFYFRRLLRSAEAGDAEAQLTLGFMYDFGVGVLTDSERAMELFSKAAEQGLAAAELALGDMYERHEHVARDYVKAAAWYRKAADQGLAEAQYRLGGMYANGYGVQQSDTEAFAWCRRAAEQGYSDAQIQLSRMYSIGRGTERDDALAAKWFDEANSRPAAATHELAVDERRILSMISHKPRVWYRWAAEQGSAYAQYVLGICLNCADPRIEDEAESWLLKAADQGLADAQHRLGYLYQHGIGVPKDIAHAEEWYRKAAAQGFSAPLYNLGYIYAAGDGVEPDAARADYWFGRAVVHDITGMRRRSSKIYSDGLAPADPDLTPDYAALNTEEVVEIWYDAAVKRAPVCGADKAEYRALLEPVYKQPVTWYLESADQGDPEAQYTLGILHTCGIGVHPDDEQARYWLKRAVDQGYDRARPALQP
ncbi:MAG: sel1 repeat family protein [Methylobacteriaceae bacterium]|nr:sel1 repeat family protein [Methylobacteriaceae bacterium]